MAGLSEQASVRCVATRSADRWADRSVIRSVIRSRAGLLAVLALGAVLASSGCGRWIGYKHKDVQRASMVPGSVLNLQTHQKGTVIKLTNTGNAPLEVHCPSNPDRVWTIEPGSYWRNRMRVEREVEVANRSDEATRVEIFAKAWNFRMRNDIEHRIDDAEAGPAG